MNPKLLNKISNSWYLSFSRFTVYFQKIDQNTITMKWKLEEDGEKRYSRISLINIIFLKWKKWDLDLQTVCWREVCQERRLSCQLVAEYWEGNMPPFHTIHQEAELTDHMQAVLTLKFLRTEYFQYLTLDNIHHILGKNKKVEWKTETTECWNGNVLFFFLLFLGHLCPGLVLLCFSHHNGNSPLWVVLSHLQGPIMKRSSWGDCCFAWEAGLTQMYNATLKYHDILLKNHGILQGWVYLKHLLVRTRVTLLLMADILKALISLNLPSKKERRNLFKICCTFSRHISFDYRFPLVIGPHTAKIKFANWQN